MAETLDISRATLINYEKGHTEISLGFLEKLKNDILTLSQKNRI